MILDKSFIKTTIHEQHLDKLTTNEKEEKFRYFCLISLLGHLVLFHLILKIIYFSFSVHNASINLAKD